MSGIPRPALIQEAEIEEIASEMIRFIPHAAATDTARAINRMIRALADLAETDVDEVRDSIRHHVARKLRRGGGGRLFWDERMQTYDLE